MVAWTGGCLAGWRSCCSWRAASLPPLQPGPFALGPRQSATAPCTIRPPTTTSSPSRSTSASGPPAARARDWAVARLTALGFANVHVEPFPITAWIRGPEDAEVAAPHPQKLAIIGLGGSVPTPPQGVEGEVALFHTYAELLAAPSGSLGGKIAVVPQPMPRAREGSGYGLLNPARRAGPSEAARRGAIAYLVRSLATGMSREPHTGQ